MTTQTQTNWAGDLIALLEQQRDIYRRLDELSQSQSELVASGEAEPLLDVLAQRQSLIDELTRVNGRLDPYKQQWPTLFNQLDDASQQRIRALIDEVQKLLDRIIEQDEKDRQALSAQRDRAGDSMRQLSAGSAVNQAYGRHAGGTDHSRFTDQQG